MPDILIMAHIAACSREQFAGLVLRLEAEGKNQLAKFIEACWGQRLVILEITSSSPGQVRLKTVRAVTLELRNS